MDCRLADSWELLASRLVDTFTANADMCIKCSYLGRLLFYCCDLNGDPILYLCPINVDIQMIMQEKAKPKQ